MALDTGLRGVHVLVTGASGGIGIEVARSFLQLGAKVSAHYNSSQRELSEITSSSLKSIQAEVTREADVATLFDVAEQAHGIPVQILIVNHGVWPTKSVELADMTLAQWRNTHAVNLDGSFLLCREFLRRLRGKPAEVLDPVSICFIGSTAGKFGEADHADYSSTKSALMYGLTRSLKNEIIRIAPKGRVNSVDPGYVKTPLVEEVTKNEKLMAVALASTPLRKTALPIDIANQVVVVSSPALSGHLTGVNVSVDGGMEGRCLFPP